MILQFDHFIVWMPMLSVFKPADWRLPGLDKEELY